MSFIDSSSSVIQATLTRRGRELLATDSSKFSITQFAFGDDEINYSFFDGTSPDADNFAILAFPIIEPASENKSPLRWSVATYPSGNLSVADLDVPKMPDGVTDRKLGFVAGSQNLLTIRTLRGYDNLYYVASSDESIVAPIRDRFSSVQDTTKFDQPQSQSKGELWFNVPGIFGDVTTITIKGGNSGIVKVLYVQVYDTKEEAIADAFNPVPATKLIGRAKPTGGPSVLTPL